MAYLPCVILWLQKAFQNNQQQQQPCGLDVKVSFFHQGPASGWMGEFCQPSNLTAFKHVQHFSKQIGSLIWSTVQHPGGRAGDLIAQSWWSHSAVFLKSSQTFHFDKTRSQREGSRLWHPLFILPELSLSYGAEHSGLIHSLWGF